MFGVYYDLYDARENFYRDYALADFQISVKAVPENYIRLLAEVEGVQAIEGSVTLEGRAELEGFADPIQTTLVGIRPGGSKFNKLLFVDGSDAERLQSQEAFASSAFFDIHKLQQGDSLEVVLLGQRETFKLRGAAQSPEYVYVLAPGGGLAPDPLRTAVLFCSLRKLQEAGELENSYNLLSGSFTDDVRGHPEREKAVLTRLSERLETYGVTSAIPRSQFLSVTFLDSDIVGLKASAYVMPTLCMIIVTVVLNVVMGRLISGQRTVVGTLKALGYPTYAVTIHYLGFGLIVGLLGAAGGLLLGRWFQTGMLSLYQQVYELPIREAGTYPRLLAVAVGLSLGCSILGTAFGVRSATKLEPAAAMRPPPPEKGGKILLERGPFRYLWNSFPFSFKLMLRAIFRNPFRSLVTLGSSFVATTIMVESLAMGGAIGVFIDREFRVAQQQDVSVNLRLPRALVSTVREFEVLPGVIKVEPQLLAPALIKTTSDGVGQERQVAIQGLPAQPDLQNPLRYTPALQSGLPKDQPGIFLARKLAEVLGTSVGDELEVELRSGTRRTVRLRVLGLVDTTLGLGAYMEINQLSKLTGELAVADKILLKVDADQRQALVAELQRRPLVLNVTWRADSLKQMNKTMQENMGVMLSVIIIFSGFLAFGAVLNTALVALSEREREVGTLRVLGYSPLAVTAIFSGESLFLNTLGVIFGWAGGAGLTYAVSRAYDTEVFRFPYVMSVQTIISATLAMSVFLLASQIVLGFIVKRLPWLDVLKIRE